MVLAISAPALADDLNPPDWAGGPGTIYGIWNFDVKSPSGETGSGAIREDYPEEGAMVPHGVNPDPAEFTETSDPCGAHKYMQQDWTEGAGWSWSESFEGRDGVISNSGLGFTLNNFEGSGTKLVRAQITWWPAAGAGDWEFWFARSNGGELGPLYPDDYLVAEIEDLGDGWRHSTYEIEISDNPSDEGLWVGTWGNNTAIDQIVIDTICYPGDEPPVGPGRKVVKPPVTVDSSDLPIYEPYDPPDGPSVEGPTEGQMLVSLAWPPGEGVGYPSFNATVKVDPNSGDGKHEDFIFPASTAADGSVELKFTDANWSDPQAVAVQALQDTDREGDEKYPIELTVTIDIADPNFGNPTPVVVESRVGVVDNDVPFISLSTDEIEISESDPCTCVDLKIRLSHKPDAKVGVWVNAGGYAFSEDEEFTMFIIDPNFEQYPPLYADPNRMTFTVSGNPEWNQTTMTSNWNVEQTITVCPIDNDELAEAWVEYIDGQISLTPYSEDLRYRVPDLNADGSEAPGNPPDSGGEAEETIVDISVQDNECGAIGYSRMDFNEDCNVGLADLANIYAQWLYCTEPFEEGCDMAWILLAP